MAGIAPYFPQSHGVPRVHDRRVVSGIVHVIKHGLHWNEAPVGYRPHKTLYNRFVSWSRMGGCRIFARLSGEGRRPERIMIDAIHTKAYRTAASLLKQGRTPVASGTRKAD